MAPCARSLLLCLVVATTPAVVAAQFPPDSFTNLRVLPDTIAQRDLLDVMRGFTFALGVSCQHCHAGSDDTPLDSIDFASDEKRTKRTARLMLRMVAAINDEHLSGVPDRPAPHVVVRCVTCHRGLQRPTLIQDVLNHTLSERGADAAVETYRTLRDEFLVSGSYDFSAETLNEFAASLLRRRQSGDAIALLTLSTELNPQSLAAHFYLGEAHRAVADTARALASYRRALEIQPDHAFIRRLVDQLTRPRP